MGCDELDTADYFIITLKVSSIILLSSIGIRAYESNLCASEWSVGPIVSAGLLAIGLIIFMSYELCFVTRTGFLTLWQFLLIISIITSANLTNINNSFTSNCDLDNEINTSGVIIPVLLGFILTVFNLKALTHYRKVIKLIDLKKQGSKKTSKTTNNIQELFRRSNNIEYSWRNDTDKLKL